MQNYEPHTIKDALAAFASPRTLRDPAFRILNTVQREKPAVQVYAIAAALVGLCEPNGVDVHDVVTAARKMADAVNHTHAKQARALRNYARGELNVS